MRDEDLYKILGVGRGAEESEIKKSYRKLARELHPDKNKGNKEAEERFKKVSAAYAVLGNHEKRKLYDQYGIDGLRDGFDPKMWERAQGFGRPRSGRNPYEDAGFGGFAGFGGMEDIFESLFGRRQPGSRAGSARRHSWSDGVERRGADVQSRMTVELLDAVLGRELQIVVPVEGERKQLKVKLPMGIESGKSIRLKGQGAKGENGGENGDLIVEVEVKEDDRYERKALDLVKREDISVGKAFFGGTLEVETPWGKGKIAIPEKTRGGSRIRVKGHGVRKSGESGDLYVALNIVLPEEGGEGVQGAIEIIEKYYGKK